MLRLVVAPVEQGLRLDAFLAAVTNISRRRARALIAAGLVVRNGRPVRVQSRAVAAGDVVDLFGDDDGSLQVRPTPSGGVRFLHEDPWLLVVDKPAGVLSQPAAGRGRDELSLDQQVTLALADRDGRRPFLRLVHRLDRLTSGAVLFARNPQATKALAGAWAQGKVERLYLALVEGEPGVERLTMAEPVARAQDHPWRFRVAPAGAPARTEIEVLHRFAPGRALVRCRLLSGRTHQVRVHLAAAGHPVLGDTLYGARRGPGVARPMLHAHLLDLPHPRTGEPLRVTAPVPADFRALLPREALEAIGEPETES